MAELSPETIARLHHELVRLGDMMGDGLHLEPDGKWISREYRNTLKALGFKNSISRHSNSPKINERMKLRVNEFKCGNCTGELQQTRSGSKRAICQSCGGKWQLIK